MHRSIQVSAKIFVLMTLALTLIAAMWSLPGSQETALARPLSAPHSLPRNANPRIFQNVADKEYAATETKRIEANVEFAPGMGGSSVGFKVEIASDIAPVELRDMVVISLHRGDEELAIDLLPPNAPAAESPDDFAGRLVRWKTSTARGKITVEVEIEATENPSANEDWLVEIDGLPGDPTTRVTVGVNNGTLSQFEVDPIVIVRQEVYTLTAALPMSMTLVAYGVRNVYPSTGEICGDIDLHWQAIDGADAPAITSVKRSTVSGGMTVCGVNGEIWVTGITASRQYAYRLLGSVGEFTNEAQAVVDVVVQAPLKAISAGDSFTCGLTPPGGVKCWGNNDSGQLGNGTRSDESMMSLTPTDVIGLSTGVIAVAAGGAHACALTIEGGVKCWGANWSGQIGDGTGGDYGQMRLRPVDVVGLTAGVQAIAAGTEHTCALTTSGGVKCWGNNWSGRLGDGTFGDTLNMRLTPVDVVGLASGIKAIEAGGAHSCALTIEGGVKCWGSNWHGELGINKMDNDYPVPTDVTGLQTGVQAISTHGSHVCALTDEGGVKCWGANWSGQVGDGSLGASSGLQLTPIDVVGLTTGVRAIEVGGIHSCALTTQGQMQCWGADYSGQIGDGTSGDETGSRPAPTEVVGLGSRVTAFSAGQEHTCALTEDGGVKCWGANNSGQLGALGDTMRLTAVNVVGLSAGVRALALGGAHSCALTNAGGVKCWGGNDYGQVGTGTPDNGDYYWLTPMDAVGLTGGIQAIAAGNQHTCALTFAGGVKCWGANWLGQRGDGTTDNHIGEVLAPTDVIGLVTGVQAIAAGTWHTCALTLLGEVFCWGDNSVGQLGDGAGGNAFSPNPFPVQVIGLTSGVQALVAAGSHTCALTTQNRVMCWGRNTHGQLGVGSGGEFDMRLQPATVIGLDVEIESLAAGSTHTCALTTQGAILCWGSDAYGQLGDGTRGDDYFMRQTPVEVAGFGTEAVAVAAGLYHTCALTIEGGVKCWGDDAYGQLGDGSRGDDDHRRLLPVNVVGLTSGVQAIAASGFNFNGLHTCALTIEGGVLCWGSNFSGQLGDGTRGALFEAHVRPLDVDFP